MNKPLFNEVKEIYEEYCKCYKPSSAALLTQTYFIAKEIREKEAI